MLSRTLLNVLQALQDQTNVRSLQPPDLSDSPNSDTSEQFFPSLLHQKLSIPHSHAKIMMAVKTEVIENRITRMTTSRIVESAVCRILLNSQIPAVVMRLFLERFCRLFEHVKSLKDEWLITETIDLTYMHDLLETGNERQHFHAINGLRPLLRKIVDQLARSSQLLDSVLLNQLGNKGIISPARVLFWATTAAAAVVPTGDGTNSRKIFGPPVEEQQRWKSMSRITKRRRSGMDTYDWCTTLRVKDTMYPPISESEVSAAFGPEATLATTYGYERLPYHCGANKYELVKDNIDVVAYTRKGMALVAGLSGSTYSFMNMWLVLGGPEEDLPLLRLALAALNISGSHHSLIEVMAVCVSFIGRGRCSSTPDSLVEMVEQLVPHEMETSWRGKTYSVTPEKFHNELEEHLGSLMT